MIHLPRIHFTKIYAQGKSGVYYYDLSGVLVFVCRLNSVFAIEVITS
jgi:hypothetical protein